jgi:hypothetical protein
MLAAWIVILVVLTPWGIALLNNQNASRRMLGRLLLTLSVALLLRPVWSGRSLPVQTILLVVAAAAGFGVATLLEIVLRRVRSS